jgi:potassium-transporting ATPase potassium-binding subunit
LDKTIEFGILIVGTIDLATIFGAYLARMIAFEMRPLEKTLLRVAGALYKVKGISATKQMNLKEDFLYLFMSSTNNQSLDISNQFNNLILIQ